MEREPPPLRLAQERGADPRVARQILRGTISDRITSWCTALTGSDWSIRPAFHRREDRIRAHVQLCWLALLVLRVAEIEVGDTWRNIRNELDRTHLVIFATNEGTVSQRSETTPGQRKILGKLRFAEPPRYYDFAPAPEPVAEG